MSTRQIILLITPLFLIADTYVMFWFLPKRLGFRMGYLLSFISYWLTWCFLMPLILLAFLGDNELSALFADGPQRFGSFPSLGMFLLAVPVVLAYAYGPFQRNFPQATPKILLLSFLIALVNAVGEELLWRGAFAALFPGNWLLGVVYPAAAFGLWHLSPQAALPYAGGKWAFIASAIFLGLCWGWVAYSSGSILWTTVSHVLVDFSGIGALIYFRQEN